MRVDTKQNQLSSNFKLSEDSLNKIAERCLLQAKKLGASDSEVSLTLNKGFSIKVRNGEVETVEYHKERNINITVYFQNCKGSSSTTEINDSAIQDAINGACDIANKVASDKYVGLVEKNLLAFNYPDLDLYHPWQISPEEAIKKALFCEQVGRKHDKRIKYSDGVEIFTNQGYYFYINTNDFIGSYSFTRHRISSSLVASENESMQRDFYYTVSRVPEELEALESIAKQSAERVIARLGARRLATRKSSVVFHRETARSLLKCFVSAISGYNLYKQSSFLADSLNKKIFPDWLTIQELPLIKKAIGSAPFDKEGVATKEKLIVENGRLCEYILDGYSARRLGTVTTGNASGVHNLFVKPGQLNFESLLMKMGEGLIVTELLGHGVNIVTGDYSQGAAGFWVKNGEIQFPVEEITIAGNLKDMFLNIKEISNDIEFKSSILTGSIWIDSMMIAGE